MRYEAFGEARAESARGTQGKRSAVISRFQWWWRWRWW